MRRLRTPFIAIKAPTKCKRYSHAVFVYLAGPNTSQFIIILHPFSLTLQLFIQKRTDFDQKGSFATSNQPKATETYCIHSYEMCAFFPHSFDSPNKTLSDNPKQTKDHAKPSNAFVTNKCSLIAFLVYSSCSFPLPDFLMQWRQHHDAYAVLFP